MTDYIDKYLLNHNEAAKTAQQFIYAGIVIATACLFYTLSDPSKPIKIPFLESEVKGGVALLALWLLYAGTGVMFWLTVGKIKEIRMKLKNSENALELAISYPSVVNYDWKARIFSAILPTLILGAAFSQGLNVSYPWGLAASVAFSWFYYYGAIKLIFINKT